MKHYKTENFFFGYFDINCKTKEKGILFYKSYSFAHVWQWSHNDFGNIGKWQLNPDKVALEYNFPKVKPFESLESLMDFCENWAKENNLP